MSAITSDATLSLCSSLFCSSFRRRPESSSFFVFSAEVQCFHSPCGRAGNFSLLVQRKVTKRNTPQVARLPGILPSRFASGLRGSLNAHPCACSELARILRATLRAFPPPARRATGGPVWAASCRRSKGSSSSPISARAGGARLASSREVDVSGTCRAQDSGGHKPCRCARRPSDRNGRTPRGSPVRRFAG